MKVLILQGIPGSGKTTWARAFIEKNTDWIRVSRDDLRNMRGRYWLPKQEDLITAMEFSCIQVALRFHKKNVIIDATNLNPGHLVQLKAFIKEISNEAEIEIKFFDTPLEKCIENDLRRENSVGEKVIRQFYDKYLKPKVEHVKQDASLPHAIICDLDGTLAIHNGRGPFEYHKCNTDLENKVVADIIFKYGPTHHIIFLSGREDSCKEKTIQWLTDTLAINNPIIFMRKTGDMRKDCIIKKEIFDEHIKDRYYVEFCLDDRNQVVELWRSMGLTCLQVAEGDF